MSEVLQNKKVAVLLETEYIPDEIRAYQTRFEELGMEVDLLTYMWGEKERTLVSDVDSPDKEIETLKVTKCVTDVRVEDYVMVLMAANYCAVRLREIPPMFSLGSVDELTSPPAVKFYADAMSNKNIIKGALCHALWILTPHPELLKGRKVICHTVVLADIYNAGGVFVPEPTHVVVDEDLITARSADDIDIYVDTLISQTSKMLEGIK